MGHIVSLAHTAYVVKDMKASLDFYCGKLGMEHAFSIPNDKGEPWIEYLKVAEGQFIELFYANGKIPKNGSYMHLCLRVDDCRAACEELKSLGVSIDSEPKQGKDFNWQCWIHDPDGNPIELMQIVPESPQARA
ncbi:MAG: VOC family protein [Christensenellales bacterium]|jgi:catechol 2,3-dioxygenase-like lactoylglutathione lyase family enzyme